MHGEDLMHDVEYVMSTPEGRRFVYRLIGLTGVYRLSFDHTKPADQLAMTMRFREGEKNVGLKLIDMVSAKCPRNYLRMLEESKQ